MSDKDTYPKKFLCVDDTGLIVTGGTVGMPGGWITGPAGTHVVQIPFAGEWFIQQGKYLVGGDIDADGWCPNPVYADPPEEEEPATTNDVGNGNPPPPPTNPK